MNTATENLTAMIDWPNGEGYTPCTAEYAAKMTERDAIFDPTFDEGSTDDLSPEDYNRWHTLQHELENMLGSGKHVGKSVRY